MSFAEFEFETELELFLSRGNQKMVDLNVVDEQLLRNLVSQILFHSKTSELKTIEKPLVPLQLLINCLRRLQTCSSQNEVYIKLNEEESSILRGLFVQCFHGAAKETNRHEAFKILNELLQPSTRILDTFWTIERKAPYQFSPLVCSFIRGEIHFYFEEFIDLYNTLYMESNISNISNDSNEQTKESKIKKLLGRYNISFSFLLELNSLCETILNLLISPSFHFHHPSSMNSNNNLVSNESDEVDESGPWSTLPPTAISQIQKNMYSCVDEKLDIIKWGYEKLQQKQQHNINRNDNGNKNICNEIFSMDASLFCLIRSSCQSSCTWIIEDQSLHSLFTSHLFYLLPFSFSHPLSRNIHSNKVLSDEERHSLLWQSISQICEGDINNFNQVVEDDIIQFIIPTMMRIFDSLEEDIRENKNDKNFVAKVESLLGVSPLFTCLIHTIISLLNNMSNNSFLNELVSDNSLLIRIESIFISSCMLCEVMIGEKKSSLENLVKNGEGFEALTSVFGYNIPSILVGQFLNSLSNFIQHSSMKKSKAVSNQWKEIVNAAKSLKNTLSSIGFI